MVTGGKLTWAICFALLLLSTPLLVSDLLMLQRSVEESSGADFWYEAQLNREVLRLKLELTQAKLGGEAATSDADIRFQIDLVFSRLNTLPKRRDNDWHTQGIADLKEIGLIRREIEAIDATLPLLESDRPAFLAIAIAHIDATLEHSRALSLRVAERQNSLVGALQALFKGFQQKLLAYAIGFILLVLGLIYLMVRYIRSERDLRASNQRLTEMAIGLSKARDAAVEASRAKGRFLANASHELRTPLNGIIGFSELLQGGYAGALSQKQVEYVEDIHNSAERLLLLINDILDLSKVEAGKQTLAEEEMFLDQVVRQAVHDAREIVRRASLTVHIEAEPALPAIRGDAARMRQVIDNLLSNAIKFTPAGGAIRFNLARPPAGGIRVTVTDTGIGIESDELRKVFNAFEQVDSAYARKQKGTGLGLPLAKAFIELHGGTIAVSSEIGVGTEILVELPASRVFPGAVANHSASAVAEKGASGR
ncbi:ATP-binding protein [Rhodospirillaceae bacterium SYSU D60014]|uniref:sensor histidine kinase n=1 Tax=Virgifigura deserti TaxID=2268457 RepID=UPI000E66E14E